MINNAIVNIYRLFFKILFFVWVSIYQIIETCVIKISTTKNKYLIIDSFNLDLLKKHKRIVVVAISPNKNILNNTKLLIDCFIRKGFLVVCGINGSITDITKNYLQCKKIPYFIRKPHGRDFGIFKTFMNLIYENSIQDKSDFKIVYINDSFFSYEHTTESIVEHLTDSLIDYAGLTENYHNGYHISSYAFSVSGSILQSKFFLEFWMKYKPLSTRRHTIFNGEIGLSKQILKHGFYGNVLFDLNSISELVFKLNDEQIEYLISLYTNPHTKFRISNTNKQNKKSILKEIVCQYIFKGSNVHHAAAFLIASGAGIVKHDISYRRIINPYNVRKLLQIYPLVSANDDLVECEKIIIQKRHPYSMSKFERLLYDNDII